MCVLCGRSSESFPIENSSCIRYRCSNCGNYGVTETFFHDLQWIDNDTKVKLTHLLAEYKLKQNPPILLASSPNGYLKNYIWKCYKDLISEYPREALEILDRTLLNLSRLVQHPADKICIDEKIKELFFSKDIESVIYIVRQLSTQGYTTNTTSTPNDIFIEANGWNKIAELKKKPSGLLNQAFVAMWFDDSVNKYFTHGIQKSIEDSTNYKPIRIDFVEHNNKICDQIIAEIRKSKLLIADFTGDRGGVYFEAGFAQGLGIPVIWIVQEDWVEKLHFDTRQYNHIIYKNELDLYEKLKVRIEATIVKNNY